MRTRSVRRASGLVQTGISDRTGPCRILQKLLCGMKSAKSTYRELWETEVVESDFATLQFNEGRLPANSNLG